MGEKDYYSKSELKARGWTDVSILNFLKVHDKEAVNPCYRTAPPMKLYLITRVDEMEKTDVFKLFMQKSNVRKEASKKAVETKKEQLLNTLNQWIIYVKKKDYQQVLRGAIQSYNTFKKDMASDRDDLDFDKASINSDEEFLQRICVNHLRHQFSNYDDKLDMLFGKVGKADAYKVLNSKIYDAITVAYPQLAQECQRQFDRKCSEQYESGEDYDYL